MSQRSSSQVTPATTPSASAIPSRVNTPAPGSPAILPQHAEPEPPKRRIATRRLKYLGEHIGYASEEIVDLEALKRQQQKGKKKWVPKGPFRFFDMPVELRLKVLEFALLRPSTVDLDPENYKTLAPRLQLFLTSKRMHEEAYRVFYGKHTIRVFPIHSKFFNLKRLTVIQRLPRRYRNAITSIELRLGPGWQDPPDWVIPPRFGLRDCHSLRHLRIFVQIDPSHDVFKGFRISDDFYTKFSSRLVQTIMNQVPSLEIVEFEAYPGITKDTPLMLELLDQVRRHGKRIVWGTERGWDADDEPRKKIDEMRSLEKALALVSVSS